MGDTASTKETRFAPVGAVDILIHEQEGAGGQLGTEGTACGKRDDIGDAEAFHGVNIRAVIDIGGGEAVAAAMAGQEDDVGLPDFSCSQDVRCLAPRGRD